MEKQKQFSMNNFLLLTSVLWVGIGVGYLWNELIIQHNINKEAELRSEKWRHKFCSEHCENVKDCTGEDAKQLINAMYNKVLDEKAEKRYGDEWKEYYKQGYLEGYNAGYVDCNTDARFKGQPQQHYKIYKNGDIIE